MELEKNSSKSTSVDDTSHTFIPTSNVSNGFRRKKGDSLFTYNLNLKVKKEKKQFNCTNPDPWARIVGSRNTAAIYMNCIATTALFDTGAEIQLVSKQFCEENEWEIQPIEKLTECSTMNGEVFGYEGFVEVNVQIPGRDFSEDHLFLVTSEISHQKEIPVVLGIYFIGSLSRYLHGIDKEEFDSLDYTVKQAYLSRVEATRIREKYGCEPPLGFVKTTKPVIIQAGTSREIHGLTKIKHGGYAVNCISEPAIGHQLPQGLKLIPGYSPLSPGSCRVSTVVENSTGRDITIPARTTICQLGLANRIPKLIYPGDDCDNDHDPEEIDDTDEGLTYKQFEQYKTVSDQLVTESEMKSEKNKAKVEIEDLGPDMEEDIKTHNQNLDSANENSIEDDGSWIVDLIDLSGLDDWPEHFREVITGLENQSKRTAKKTFVEWTEAADFAFEHLKKLCTSTPILAYPDYKLPFVLHTDSSSEGLGAVLYQKQEGKLRVIAYASRCVSKSESHYPAHKLEFLALKWAVCEKFHEYLHGSNTFEVYTDNNPLTYVLTSAKLDACGQRWVAKLANYNFTIKYKCGLSNVEADALSRISWPEVLADNEKLDVDLDCMDTHVVNAILTGSRSKSSLIESVSCSSKIIPPELSLDSDSSSNINWMKEQRADPNLTVIIKLIESGQLQKRKLHGKDSPEVKSLLRIRKSLKLVKDILYRKTYTDNSSSKKILWQLIVPKAYRSGALSGCHDDVGHQGRMRTLSLLIERFFWPGMQSEAIQYVLKCTRCLRRKTPSHVAPLQPIHVTQPLELVHMDYLSLEPSKGNIENVLVITDHFTRYALAYPSKTQTAQATARILWDNFICHYGFPEKFISDQGRNFESDLIRVV